MCSTGTLPRGKHSGSGPSPTIARRHGQSRSPALLLRLRLRSRQRPCYLSTPPGRPRRTLRRRRRRRRRQRRQGRRRRRRHRRARHSLLGRRLTCPACSATSPRALSSKRRSERRPRMFRGMRAALWACGKTAAYVQAALGHRRQECAGDRKHRCGGTGWAAGTACRGEARTCQGGPGWRSGLCLPALVRTLLVLAALAARARLHVGRGG